VSDSGSATDESREDVRCRRGIEIRTLIRRVGYGVVVIAVALSGLCVLLPALGSWLDVNQPTQSASVLLLYEENRAQGPIFDAAADHLRSDSAASAWILELLPSRAARHAELRSFAEGARTELLSRGVNDDQLEIIHTEAATFSAAVSQIGERISKAPRGSAVLLNDCFAARYTRSVLDTRLPKTLTDRFSVESMTVHGIEAKDWWRSRKGGRLFLYNFSRWFHWTFLRDDSALGTEWSLEDYEAGLGMAGVTKEAE
jgi:hypothetical protein